MIDRRHFKFPRMTNGVRKAFGNNAQEQAKTRMSLPNIFPIPKPSPDLFLTLSHPNPQFPQQPRNGKDAHSRELIFCFGMVEGKIFCLQLFRYKKYPHSTYRYRGTIYSEHFFFLTLIFLRFSIAYPRRVAEGYETIT